MTAEEIIGETSTYYFSPANWVIIGLYLFGILCMGLFFQFQRRRQNLSTSSQEYFKASSSVPGWAVGLSVFATSLSAITFISVPETTFTTDWGVVIGAMIIPLCAPFIIKYVIPFYRQLKTSTAYGYLEKRYNRSCQMIVSVFYIIYHTIRIGVVTYLPTVVISSVLPEADPYIIALVIALIAMLSAFWGGTKGVIWADVVQAIFLTLGILVMCFFGIGILNGLNNSSTNNQDSFSLTAQYAYTAGKYVSSNRWVLTFSELGIPCILMTYLVNVLYSMVCGHDVVQRYQSAKRLSDTKKALYLNSCMFLISFFTFYGFGTILYQLFTSSYSLGEASGYGVAYFGDESGVTAALTGGGTDISSLNISALGYSNVKGIISNYTNFQGVTNQFISQIEINGTSYGLISTTSSVPYFIVTVLPVGVSGIVIASVMAAAQGTNAAGMSSGAEVFVRDMVLPYKPNISGKTQVWMGKCVTIAMGVVGYAITAVLIAGGVTQVYLFFNSFQGIFGAPVLAAFLMGMFGTYIKKNAMTLALSLGHIFAIAIFIVADNNVAALAGWNGGSGYFNNQWDGVFVFAFVIVLSFVYQFFENWIRLKNPFTADKAFKQTIENLSWASVSKNHQIIEQVELSVSWDEAAYAKYVKGFFRDKQNSKDPLVLQKQLTNYKDFITASSYDRYVSKVSQWNKYRTMLFKKVILTQNDFYKYRNEYLVRELERNNISAEYKKAFD